MVDLEDVRNVQCNYCQKPFDIEDDEDDEGHPFEIVNVPVECDKGKFCSEAHRAQAMYEAQDEAGREVLRRYVSRGSSDGGKLAIRESDHGCLGKWGRGT